jgi:hypothetical protein
VSDSEIDSQLAQVIAEIGRVDRERAALMERLLAIVGKEPSTRPPSGPTVVITPGQASEYCGRTENVIRRDCELHPYDPGGFGLRVGKQWGIDKGRYIAQRGTRSA